MFSAPDTKRFREPLARILFLLVVFCAAAANAAPTITARIQPNQIPLGQDARLEVTISGASNAPTPRPPPIPGLEIQNMGQTMSMQFVNGAMSSDVTNTFLVRPAKTGEFEIPPMTVTVGGTTLRTPALTLLVVDAGRGVRRVDRTRPATGSGDQAGGSVAETEDAEIALLEVQGVPDRELFVGEVLPVEIVLYVREGTRVTEATPPALVGSGFTLQRPSDNEPAQQRVRLANGRYTKLTFPAALSPIAAGDVPLEASIELTARIPQKVPRQRRRFDDPFFDSFFEPFAYRAVQQKVPVSSPPRSISVAPLPEKGRPESFTGGVGRFSLKASADPTAVAIGDPITLEVSVYGKGNFDRLQLPGLEDSPDWKTYDPTSSFDGEDALGISGRKTFEQALLPLDTDLTQLPERNLSYFDPEERRYVTLSIDSIGIEVAAAPTSHRPRAIGQRIPSGTDRYELAPNKIELGSISATLEPIATRVWFPLLPALPILGVAGALWFGRRRRRLLADPVHARDRKVRAEIERLLIEMDRSVRAGDASAFFMAARRAIQEGVAGIDGDAAAASLTKKDIENRLDGLEDLRARACDVFDAADALSYGGSGGIDVALADTRDEIASLLQEIGKVRR